MKPLSFTAALTLATMALGASAQAHETGHSHGTTGATCSPNNWGLMNYGVCYYYDPYAEVSSNYAAHAGNGMYGSNTYGQTLTGGGYGGQGFWGTVSNRTYDGNGRWIVPGR